MILSGDLERIAADLPPWAVVICFIALLVFIAFLLWLLFTK